MKIGEYVCWLIIVICSIFATIWLIQTYTAESYKYGTQSAVSSNLSFIIQLDTVTFEEQDNKYIFRNEFASAYQVDSEFDADKYNYNLLLNDNPLPNSRIYAGIAECNMPFTFLDARGNALYTDTLYFSVQFNRGATVLEMYTLDQNAVKYWTSYFNAYGLDIRIYKEGEK